MNISIEPLLCGSLTAATSMFEVGGPDTPITLPVPSWLIRHPRGNVLVDCGMHSDLARPGPARDAVSAFFTLDLDESKLVHARLQDRGVDPADVDFVILSHLHFDHAGGLAQVPNAKVLVQADEWAAGFDDELRAANSFRKADYDLGHDLVTVDGEHDVFGDGAISCIPTPGHTPGHQSVRIRLEHREVVLCCDCAYFERTLNGGARSPVMFNAEASQASIARLVAMRDAGAQLIPGHDPKAFAALPERMT